MLLTIDQLTGIFAVSKPTISRWAELGVIPPPIRIAEPGRRGSVRWKKADIEAFIAEHPTSKNFGYIETAPSHDSPVDLQPELTQ